MRSIPRANGRSGYSLIELMIVIAIIAILATIAMISMINYRLTIKANTAMREVAQELRVARSKAIRENHPYLFRIYKSVETERPDLYGYCASAVVPSGTVNQYYECGGFLTPRALPDGIIFAKAFGSHSFVLPPLPGVEIGHDGGVNVGGTNKVGYGRSSPKTFQWAFYPDGSCSHNVVVNICPYNDFSNYPTRVDRARAVSITRISGSIRAWRWTNSWN